MPETCFAAHKNGFEVLIRACPPWSLPWWRWRVLTGFMSVPPPQLRTFCLSAGIALAAGSGLWLGSYWALLAISTGSKPQDQCFHRTPGSHTLHIVWAEAVLRIQGGAESSVCCSHEGLCLCCRAVNRPLWIFTVPRECPYTRELSPS